MSLYRTLRLLYWTLAIIFFLFDCKAIALASDYKTVYDAHYSYVSEEETKVNLDISFSNIRPDISIYEYSISYPKDFSIYNLTISDEKGPLPSEKTTVGRFSKIRIFLSSTDQHQERKIIHFSYNQKKLFNKVGNIFEVLIPTIKGADESTFNIKIQAPSNFDAKLSFAKPRPNSVRAGVYTWEDVKEPTIYLTFGAWQGYKLNLKYYLENNEKRSGYAQIALPPETAYQKIFVEKLEPNPDFIKLDTDGNYLANYLMEPNSQKAIIFEGAAQVFSQRQPTVQKHESQQFDRQKQYLTDQIRPWTGETGLTDETLREVGSVEDIYHETVTALNYNYDRLTENSKRRTTAEILDKREDATCREFSDLFIAITREKGLYAREMVGYGFTNSPSIRPLSYNQDVLHAWPEYFDKSKNMWIAVDPTWEDTSGIDYFSSFDLNHIVFAIHGMDPTYPLAAGSYKKNQTHDIDVVPTSNLPHLNKKITINKIIYNGPSSHKNYQGAVEIENTGNVFLIDDELSLATSGLKPALQKLKIDYLAPFQKITLPFFYSLNGSAPGASQTIDFIYNGETIKTTSIKTSTSIYFKSAFVLTSAAILLYFFNRHKPT